MPADPGLDPRRIAERLAQLRALYTPETVEDARRRLSREAPRVAESFTAAAARRLRELRALDDLARHLRRGIPASGLGPKK